MKYRIVECANRFGGKKYLIQEKFLWIWWTYKKDYMGHMFTVTYDSKREAEAGLTDMLTKYDEYKKTGKVWYYGLTK